MSQLAGTMPPSAPMMSPAGGMGMPMSPDMGMGQGGLPLPILLQLLMSMGQGPPQGMGQAPMPPSGMEPGRSSGDALQSIMALLGKSPSAQPGY